VTLFKYLQERIRTRRGKVPAAFNLATAWCEAAYLSKVIARGLPLFLTAREKNRLPAAPGIAHRPGVSAPAFLELRDVALHPPRDGRVGYGDAAFGHHLDQVTGTELERQVPPHAQDDNFWSKAVPWRDHGTSGVRSFMPKYRVERFMEKCTDLRGRNK
jgi:hypothetical protein